MIQDTHYIKNWIKTHITKKQQGGEIKHTTPSNDPRTKKPDKYLKDWISHPEFEKRITAYNEGLSVIDSKRTFDMFGLLNSHGHNVQKKSIEKLNDPKTKLYFNSKSSDVEKLEKSRGTNMGYQGEFFKDKQNNPSIYINDTHKPESTYIHERTHQTRIDYGDYFSKMMKGKDYRKDAQANYLQKSSNEVYPRLMEFRYENKIKPGQTFSEGEVKQFRQKQIQKDNSTFGFSENGSADLFRLFDDSQLKKILNEVALNRNNTNTNLV